MTNDELLYKWLENTISTEDLNIFKLRPEYESLTTLYRHTAHMEGPSMDSEAMLKTILATPKGLPQNENTTAKPKTRRLSTWFKLGIAASVILISGYFLFPTNTQEIVSFQIAEGRMTKGKFPDDSKFMVSGNSTLSYDSNSWHEARTVNLDGEATFSVIKGTTFTVNAPDVSVEVLGTEFTVTSRGDGDFVVKCKSGSVQVKAKNGKAEEVLQAGESVFMTKAGKFTNLRQDLSRFKNVPLQEVMTELEKTFRIVFYNENDKIDTKQILTCNFQHSNLNQALKTTLTPLGIKYETFGPGQIRMFK